MRKLKSAGLISMLIMVAVFLVSSDLFSKPLTNADNPWHGKARPGFMLGTGDVENDYVIDLLMPVWGNNNALFFFNPHFRYDDNDGNEENLGFGYRRFIMDGKAILGGNIFWDTMRSENDFRYEQVGFGLEALSDVVDLRANYYHPYGTTKERMSDLDKYEFGNTNLLVHKGYEEAMKGADAEIGFLVPIISDTVETRVFGGGYWYDSAMVESVKGWKVRAEIRPMQILNINIEMKDDDVRSATFIGGYLDLPFSFGDMLAGENPFKGASKLTAFGTGTRSLKERMTDKVVRDRHIVTAALPNEQAERVLDENGEPIEMIYVNSDNDAAGDGTYANPYQDIADAPGDARYLDGAWMYVFCDDNEAGCTQADVNIDLMDDMVLWGQGYRHPFYKLGGGVMPTLDGTTGATVVYLGNNNEVMGLEITASSTAPIGIGGDGIERTNIHHNYLHDLDSGIEIYNNSNDTDIDGLHLVYTFDNNTITNIDSRGILLETGIRGDNSVSNSSITTTISNSIIEDNDDSGVDIYSSIYSLDSGGLTNVTITNRLENSTVSNNGSDGASFYSEIYTENTDSTINNARIDNYVMNNTDTINGNVGNGIWLGSDIWTDDAGSHINDSTITNNLSNNVINDNGDEGIDIESMIATWYDNSDITNALITATLNNNTVDSNGWDSGAEGVGFDSMIIFADSPDSFIDDSTIRISLTDNIITNNYGDGVLFDEDSNCGDYCGTRIYTDSSRSPITDALIDINFTGNTISGNGDEGVDFNDVRIYTGYDYLNGSPYSTYESPINSAIIDIDFDDNLIQDNSDSGVDLDEIYIYTSGSSSSITGGKIYSTFTDNVVGNDIDEDSNGNRYKGILIDDTDIFTLGYNSDIYNPLMDFTFTNNYVDGNDDENIDLNGLNIYTEGAYSSISDALITGEFTDNTATDSDDDEGFDIDLDIYTSGSNSPLTNPEISSTFTGNTASGNDNEGVDIDQDIFTNGSSSSITGARSNMSFYSNTTSYDNDGISVSNSIYTDETSSPISDVMIETIFDDNTSGNNGDNGIALYNYVQTSSFDSEIYEAYISNSFTGNDISGNNATGVNLYFQSILANGYIDDVSITNYFEDNTISDNNGAGVYSNSNYIETNANGSYINNAHIYNTFVDNNNTISGNNGAGIYFSDNYIYTYYVNTPITFSSIENTVTNNTISGNNGDGAYFFNWIANDDDYDSPISDTNIINLFEDNVMTGNEGDGIYLDNYIYTYYSDSNLDNDSIQNTFTNNTLTGTDTLQYGIYVYSELGTDDTGSEILDSDITDTFTDNIVTDFTTGIWAGSDLYDYEGTYGVVTSLLFQGNVVGDNRDDGLVLDYDISDNPEIANPAYKAWYDAHFTFDLGNGLLGSLGNNSFYGNADVALFHNLTDPWTGSLPAENNWWGSATPDFPTLIGGTYLDQYTSVNPPLPADPNPLP